MLAMIGRLYREDTIDHIEVEEHMHNPNLGR
jgi:hypothetical protein